MILDLHAILSRSRRAIVVEAGGGGDLISALGICRLLDLCGVEWRLGGFAWERFIFDPVPGPRSLGELTSVEVVSENLAVANPRSETIGGARLTEALVAAYLNAPVFLFFLSGGSRQFSQGILEAIRCTDSDLVLFVDGGGDSLAVGDEPGLISPLADSLSLAAAKRLTHSGAVLWAVSGLGCDGELTLRELQERVSLLSSSKGVLGAWGLTETALRDLRFLRREARSDVTALMIESAEGRVGPRDLRQGTRKGETSLLGSLTLFFDPSVVFRHSPIAKAVHRTMTVESSNRALHRVGVRTELDLEMAAASVGARTYRGLGEY